MRFAFIAKHHRTWRVGVMCRVLKVSRSGYYAWRGRKPSRRARREQELTDKIRKVHEQSRGLYGYPRTHQALLIDGEVVSRNTVARLMRKAKMRAKIRRKYLPRTTDSRHEKPVADNRLNRNFAAAAPNRTWLADITYVPTRQGWLYLAAVLDTFSRKIVGWSMQDHMETDLVVDALTMALEHRRPAGAQLLHHSDRGSQYASDAYQRQLTRHGITASMSKAGDCYDNAMMESFWATLKCECVQQQSYATPQQARQSLFEYIEVFYNRKRLHSSLGYVSPESFEAAA